MKKISREWLVHNAPTSAVKALLPSEPTAPPMPTTVATDSGAKLSDGVEKRLEDQPWCAAVATHSRATACHSAWANGTKITTAVHRAQTCKARRRPLRGVKPRLMAYPASHPPPMLPAVAPT